MVDGRTNFARFQKMLEGKKGVVFTIYEIHNLIAINIGSSPKIAESAIRTMAMTGLIKDVGNSRFEVL